VARAEVDSVPAHIVERSRDEMAIEIPAQIMRRVTDVDHTATIDLNLQAVHRSNWRLWCSEGVVSAEQEMAIQCCGKGV
jgi:hypothetical protein